MMRLDQRMVGWLAQWSRSCSRAACHAGDIKGKVTVQGMKSAENIAVYVDAIPGKNFPRPTHRVVMDQKNLKFNPHVPGSYEGNHCGFSEQRFRGTQRVLALHQRKQEAGAQSRHVAAGPEEIVSIQRSGRGLAAVQRPPGDVRLCGRGPHSVFRRDRQGRQLRHQGRSARALHLVAWSEEGKPVTQAVDVAAASATVDLTVKK